MTNLTDIFSLADLEDEVREGFVARKYHETADLALLNYTHEAHATRRWNATTRACRGLIYSTVTHEIVARPWPKFGNWDESGYPYPPAGPMLMSSKFDGSLGILYWPSDEVRYPSIATRSSFHSRIATHATKRLAELMSEFSESDQRWLIGEWSNPEYTYLFEIIYPKNRVVVDYAGEDRLVLLDVINNTTGRQDVDRFEMSIWPDKAEKTLVSSGFSHSIVEQIPSGEEGFVLSWPTRGFMCKMKSAEYVELHRVMTGISKKSIWEDLGAGKTTDHIKNGIPDELFSFVDDTVTELYTKCSAIIDSAYEDFDAVISVTGDSPDRKLFAREAAKYRETCGYIFMIFDGANPEDLWKSVWKTVKPVGDTRAWNRTGADEE